MAQLDPFNPFTDDQKSIIQSFPEIRNISRSEQINRSMAAAYWAEHWYHDLKGMTPRSRLIHIEPDEITLLIYEHKLSDRLIQELQAGLDDGLYFIRSSGKSSHSRKPARTVEDCLEELTNASVVMSFKYGCRYIFMREWVNIKAEYRCYVYQGMVRYMEGYATCDHQSFDLSHFRRLKELLTLLGWTVSTRVSYYDFTVDLGLTDDGSWIVIEINSPLYLYAGLLLAKYSWDRERIHTTTSPIFRYKLAGEIEEI